LILSIFNKITFKNNVIKYYNIRNFDLAIRCGFNIYGVNNFLEYIKQNKFIESKFDQIIVNDVFVSIKNLNSAIEIISLNDK